MSDREARRQGYPLTIPERLLHSDEMRRACSRRDFGEIFRLVNRRAGGVSQSDIAAAVGKMTTSRVGDIIRGVRRVRGETVIERIADGLGIPGHMLGLSPRQWEREPARPSPTQLLLGPPDSKQEGIAPDVIREEHDHPESVGAQKTRPTRDYRDAGDLEDMMRRQFLQLATVSGVLIATPQHAEPDSVVGPGNLTGTSEIADYETMNTHLWQVFSLSKSKRAVYPLVRDQLDLLTLSLQQARSRKTHMRLCALTGDLLQLAGEIFFDSNQCTEAAQCYTLAASASKEAEAYDLWACALTRHAFIGLQERQYAEATPILSAALRLAERGDRELPTRHWVSAVQAEAFAGLGHFGACERALDSAEQVDRFDGQGEPHRGWLRFDGSRLREERGTCFVQLGKTDLAEAELTDALSQKLSFRRRGSVLTDLALIGIQRHDTEQVLTWGGAALRLAEQTGSGYVERKLQLLRERLAPFTSDARISELSDKILSLQSP